MKDRINALFLALEDDRDLAHRRLGILFTLPNMLPQSCWRHSRIGCPGSTMTLGLDLQGGSHILLAVDRQDLINERLQATRDEIRTLLRDAKIGYTGLAGSGRTVQVRIRDASRDRQGQGRR